MPSFTLGIDDGTNLVRAVVVDTGNGRELGTGMADDPSGTPMHVSQQVSG